MINNLFGDVYAKELNEELKSKCQKLQPSLAVISAGADYGSKKYAEAIKRKCDELGINISEYHYPAEIGEEELIMMIKALNDDVKTDGILLQLPLPKRLSSEKIIEQLDPNKDVDGIHPFNMGLLFSGEPKLIPATAKAVMRLLAYYKIPLIGKEVTIVGRSNAVGKPLIALMLKENATVTVCHSYTRDLFQLTGKSGIIVSAIGRAKYLDEKYFNTDSIVIDVGINQDENGICGDVDYARVAAKVAAITPVPKGVGALTMMMLMENLTEIAAKNRR